MTSRQLIVLLFACACVSCMSNDPHKQNAPATNTTLTLHSTFELQPGDLLFQDSDCGPFCESIEKVTFGVGGAKFSHIGMVVPDGEGLVVLEAVSAGVIKTALDSFFSRSFDDEHHSKVVVGRMKPQHRHLIPEAISFATKKLGAAYDDVFDITNDRYYCSELIYDGFKHANDGQPIFVLQPMTYVDPETNELFPIWEKYFLQLEVPVPEGEPGLNPGGMSKSDYIDIVHFYGKPAGYVAPASTK